VFLLENVKKNAIGAGSCQLERLRQSPENSQALCIILAELSLK